MKIGRSKEKTKECEREIERGRKKILQGVEFEKDNNN